MIPRRANAATEMAFALPILLLIGAGIAEWGWWLSREVEVVMVARDAAHAASLTRMSDDPAGVAVARAREALGLAGFNAGAANVSTSSVTTSGGVALEVSVAVPYDDLIPLIPSPALLRARTAMRLQDQ